TDRLPQCGGIVKDRVDTDQLLQGSHPDTDPYQRMQPETRPPQIGEGATVFFLQRLPYLLGFPRRVGFPGHVGEHTTRLVELSAQHQVPGRLRDEERENT